MWRAPVAERAQVVADDSTLAGAALPGESGRPADMAGAAALREESPDVGAELGSAADAAVPAAASPPDASSLPDARPPPRPTAGAQRSRRSSGRGHARRDAKPGYLTLDSRPFSTVRIDGKTIGRVPLYRVPLSPGRHRIKAVLDDGREKSFTLTIRSGQDVRRRIRW